MRSLGPLTRAAMTVTERLTDTERETLSAVLPWHPTATSEVLAVVEQIIAAREAKARYFAMWHFFLTLPFGPFSDLVQREAIRLRALCPPPTDPSSRPADGSPS